VRFHHPRILLLISSPNIQTPDTQGPGKVVFSIA